MYIDPYERFIHKPVERAPAPPPVVTYAKVKRHPPSVYAKTLKPKRQGRGNRADWPRIAELYKRYPNKPLSFIGRRVGMHQSSVHHALKRMGLYVRRNSDAVVTKRLAARQEARANPAYITTKQQQRARVAAIFASGTHWNWATKLDAERVRAIRHMHAEGVTIVALAYKFHVRPPCISAIVHRKSWKHVP